METKTCIRCGDTRPLEQFKKDPRMHNGKAGCCKECARKEDREYRERYNAAHGIPKRSFRTSPPPFPSKQPTARKAHNLVQKAIREGELPKPQKCICTHCGKSAREYHHPRGYEAGHELDVIPLCRSCHKRVHSEKQKTAARLENSPI